MRYLIFLFLYFIQPSANAQDANWQQVLGGWVDDVYHENLFLGGSYYTRISLADIDDDGDLDMFYGGGDCGTLVYFENTGNFQEPFFQLRDEEFPGLRHPSAFGGTADVDFCDLDADGDLDAAFAWKIDRGGLVFWNDGTPSSPEFFYRYPLGPLQGQSNVTLIDIDGDDDYDYFSGQGYRERQIYFAENVGTQEVPLFEHRSHHFENLNFGIPFNFDFGDLDEDGDYDLIVCMHGGNVSYFENIGTSAEAEFNLITDDLLSGRDTTDWMETPELADIDGDGDLDLFLAGGYARLFYFENQGFSLEPNFVQKYDTSFYYILPGVGGAWLGNSADLDGDGDDDIAPGRDVFLNESYGGDIRFSRIERLLPFVAGAFADIDGDGDYDYITPGGTQTIGYYENIGDQSWPTWNSRENLFPPDGRLHYISSVAAGDLDNDGDQDLLVDHENTSVIDLYRNDGNQYSYHFVFSGELDLPNWEHRGACDVLLGDIDNDDDLDLFLGDTRSGYSTPIRLMFYRNDGTIYQPSWTFITDDFQGIVNDYRNGSIAPCLADVDRDGDKDLVMTNNSVGLQLFLNPLEITDVSDISSDERVDYNGYFIVRSYPNPANSTVLFLIESEYETPVDIEIFNLLGQRVSILFSGNLTSGNNYFEWDSSKCSTGIYFIGVMSEFDMFISRFTILK